MCVNIIYHKRKKRKKNDREKGNESRKTIEMRWNIFLDLFEFIFCCRYVYSFIFTLMPATNLDSIFMVFPFYLYIELVFVYVVCVWVCGYCLFILKICLSSTLYLCTILFIHLLYRFFLFVLSTFSMSTHHHHHLPHHWILFVLAFIYQIYTYIQVINYWYLKWVNTITDKHTNTYMHTNKQTKI